METKSKYKILVAFHKSDWFFKNDFLEPIHVGRALANKDDLKVSSLFSEMIGDDTGDNISSKNDRYNELTALYWAWKNYDKLGNPKYIGLMHYRRHFYLKKRNDKTAYFEISDFKNIEEYFNKTIKLTEKELDHVFEKADVLVSKPYYKESVYKHFKDSHDIAQLDYVRDIVKDKFPKYHESFERYLNGHNAYFCNMFIFPKEIFFEYCEFIFGVLSAYEKSDKYDGRLYVSERITGAFIQYLIDQGKRVKTAPTVFLKEDIEINTFYIVNKETLLDASMSINSLLRNANNDSFINLYILASKEERGLLEQELKYLSNKYKNFSLSLIESSELVESYSLTKIIENTKYLPSLDKVIFLNQNTLVFKDVGPLFRNDISNHYFGGILSKNSANHEEISTNVLLLNIKRIRQTKPDKAILEDRKSFKVLPCKYSVLLEHLKSENGKISFDQKYVGLVGEIDIKEAQKDPIIFSFNNDSLKPIFDENISHVQSESSIPRAKVSVIIPVYNVEKYLSYCLDSVFNQSLKDINVICINDGSIDNSEQILKDYQAKHKNLFVVNQENKGAGYARNVGISLANSEYICFIDPDDFYPRSDVLEALYNSAKENKVKLCGGSWSELIEKPDGKSFIKTNFKKTGETGYTFFKDSLMDFKDYQFDFGYHRFIYDLDFVRSNHLMFPTISRFQDPPFFVRAMIRAGKFYALKKITYCYRLGYQQEAIYNGSKLNDHTRGVSDLLFLSDKLCLPYLHLRNLFRLNGESDLYVQRILKDGDVALLTLLIKANLLINSRYINRDGSNSAYIIDPLREIVGNDRNNRSPIRRLYKYFSKYGLKTTLIRVFKGRGAATYHIAKKNARRG